MTEPYGITGELTGLAEWIDGQLGNELASRQFIAEHASARLKDIVLAVNAAEDAADADAADAAWAEDGESIPLEDVVAEFERAEVSAAPIETREEAASLPAVRAIREAFAADPGVGKMAPHNLRLLLDTLAVSGVRTGAYDMRILEWLSGWEPEICAVVAGLITRAATLAEPRVRQVLDEATRAAAEAAVSAYVRATGLPAPQDEAADGER